MDRPVSVALAQSVPELPTGTDWSYEMKLDGHRMIMWRTDDGVRLQARCATCLCSWSARTGRARAI
ncbi:DNA ligase-like domain-containing protein [Streptomyces mirabilis]|uniref:hypothetical protein n=1 Tax=Streptomyces mirabilis TaxID=68239 RepID=UPI0036AC1C28